MQLPAYSAIVLAGGRGTRLGGVHKPGVVVAGRTLLDRVLAAVDGATAVVVVGPPQPVPGDAVLVREDPPGGGPVAALAAGLTAVPQERGGGAPEPDRPGSAVVAQQEPGWTVAARQERAGLTLGGEDSGGDQPEFIAVLAADLPFLTPEALTALRGAARDRDGAVLVDGEGRDQFLAGVWRLAALRRALAGLGDPDGAPMRRLVAALDPARVALPGEPNTPAPWFDCDDPDDLTEAERWAGET